MPVGTIYLAGHSLGLMCKQSEAAVARAMDEWRHYGVGGWLAGENPWFHLVDEISHQLALLFGADPSEVTVANSTTVNLHQAIATLYRPTDSRSKIVIDSLSFPSDRFAVDSQVALRGLLPAQQVRTIPSRDGYALSDEDIESALTDEVAIAILPSVVYTSGQLLDIEWIARIAHSRGIILGVDCSHSAGVMPHEFDKWGIDFAVWSSYKYLCAGPGSTAGMYLNRRHFGTPPGLAGWFSSRKDVQFDMAQHLTPAADASAMQIGTPNILGLVALQGPVDLICKIGVDALRQRSLSLTAALIELVDSRLAGLDFSVITPRPEAQRGGHVAITHAEAASVNKALKASGVVGDYRQPNIIRLAPSPLYNTTDDIYEAIDRLYEIIRTGHYRQFANQREIVA